jgi:hypothetical protein
MALHSACSLGVINTRFRSVVSDRVRSCHFTALRQLHTSDSKYVTQVKSDSTRYDTGKAIKYNFAFCASGSAGEKEPLISFKFE